MKCQTIINFLKQFNEDKKVMNEIYYRKGNYSFSYYEGFIYHYYYQNEICIVDWDNKTFELHHCGYYPSVYTTTQLNFLEEYYKNLGCELTYRGY